MRIVNRFETKVCKSHKAGIILRVKAHYSATDLENDCEKYNDLFVNACKKDFERLFLTHYRIYRMQALFIARSWVSQLQRMREVETKVMYLANRICELQKKANKESKHDIQ